MPFIPNIIFSSMFVIFQIACISSVFSSLLVSANGCVYNLVILKWLPSYALKSRLETSFQNPEETVKTLTCFDNSLTYAEMWVELLRNRVKTDYFCLSSHVGGKRPHGGVYHFIHILKNIFLYFHTYTSSHNIFNREDRWKRDYKLGLW